MKSKSKIVKRVAKKAGLKVKKLKLAKIKPSDFKGMPEFKGPWPFKTK